MTGHYLLEDYSKTMTVEQAKETIKKCSDNIQFIKNNCNWRKVVMYQTKIRQLKGTQEAIRFSFAQSGIEL